MSATGMPTEFFEAAYRGDNDGGQLPGQAERESGKPVWDLGKPQPVLIELESAGKITGRVLDAGCGTGDFSLYLARRGYAITGFDVSSTAIERAKGKAEYHGLDAEFVVADARELPEFDEEFDTIIDCGLLHNLGSEDSECYVAGLARVAATGAKAYVIAFSDTQPGDWGPRRMTAADFRSHFSGEWSVAELQRIEILGFVGNSGEEPAKLQAWLVTAQRR